MYPAGCGGIDITAAGSYFISYKIQPTEELPSPESSSPWLSGPTGPLSTIACQAIQPARTTAPQPRTARPTGSGHERSRDMSDAKRGPAAARRCCR